MLWPGFWSRGGSTKPYPGFYALARNVCFALKLCVVRIKMNVIVKTWHGEGVCVWEGDEHGDIILRQKVWCHQKYEKQQESCKATRNARNMREVTRNAKVHRKTLMLQGLAHPRETYSGTLENSYTQVSRQQQKICVSDWTRKTLAN